MTSGEACLVLIHPAVTTSPELLEDAKRSPALSNASTLEQHLVNRVNDGNVKLADAQYDVIYYVTPEKRDEIVFPGKLIATLGSALRTGGKLYGLSNAYKVDALVNGFSVMENSGSEYFWVRHGTQESAAAVALLPKKKSANAGAAAAAPAGKKQLPTFRRKVAPQVEPVSDTLGGDDDVSDSDDELDAAAVSKLQYFKIDSDDTTENGAALIDEDTLVDQDADQDITLVTCGKTKARRRRACKDCTCGMKEMEEQEIDAARAAQLKVLAKPVAFSADELTEIDFTVQGKKVGGCGSCALGDAFRCSGCPYLGLPAFKPGQQISVAGVADDL
ncbi:LAMI_0E12530g1_1 [Lachancea mirantina]|uniref:LAMI_0E12530g1_1 n=1 Tax=Lachancea mirantina TaxID=1230905 RepID=A0A1G4JQJ4_9SACH|nr:LAMI_0E12530g1_1 [Lachancea mirantina]